MVNRSAKLAAKLVAKGYNIPEGPPPDVPQDKTLLPYGPSVNQVRIGEPVRYNPRNHEGRAGANYIIVEFGRDSRYTGAPVRYLHRQPLKGDVYDWLKISNGDEHVGQHLFRAALAHSLSRHLAQRSDLTTTA